MKVKDLFLSGATILLSGFLLSGCIKDSCKKLRTYSFYQPVYKTTHEVKAAIKSDAPKAIENPGKIFIRGDYIFLNEVDKGIHIINNKDPRSPQNVAFVNIPGNVDMAVKGNALYADLYTDLVTLDISDPLSVQVKNYMEGVFPYRFYATGFDTTRIIVDWVRRDTTLIENCNQAIPSVFYDSYGLYMAQANAGTNASAVGMGGSMARFALASDRMYTVSTTDLNVFNISSSFNPEYRKKIQLNNSMIETIFPLRNNLFIGSMSGMYIYNIDNPENPVLKGKFTHVTSCDPVIADDNYAYVTLRSGTQCQGFTNQLEVLQLNKFTDPLLLKTYSMVNPHGLSKDGNLLFICDGKAGLKVYNATNPNKLIEVMHYPGIETYDVIAYNKLALVVAKDGLYQFDFSDDKNIHLVSKLTISRQ